MSADQGLRGRAGLYYGSVKASVIWGLRLLAALLLLPVRAARWLLDRTIGRAWRWVR
jgi:hypothetical protein